MQNKKLLIITNPYSGKAKIKNHILSIVQIFSNAGFEVTVYPTKCQGDATVRAQSVKEGEFDRIVVCGGDGTLNEVITGVMQSGIKCTLGYIPSGTLNEWSSGLKISRDFKTAAKDIVDGVEIDLDIGKFNDKYFSYTASFGAFTEASYSAPQEIKNVLGQTAYFFEGIKSLGHIKPLHLKFKCDDQEIEDDFIFGAVSNSLSVGGIVKFDESLVKLNDGLFEILLIKSPKSLLQLQSIIDGILRKDLTKKEICFLHAREVTVTGSTDIPWTLDGEYAEGSDNIVLTNITSAIHLIVPKEKEEKPTNEKSK